MFGSASYTRIIVFSSLAVLFAAVWISRGRRNDLGLEDLLVYNAPPSMQGAQVAVQSAAEEVLISWAKDRGSRIGFEVLTPPGGERGGYASENYAVGDVVAAIPASACIALENNGGFPAEHAYELTLRMAQNASFVAEYAPYFSALPYPNQTLTSEVFSDALIEALQSPELEKIVKRERAVMAAVYAGKYVSQEDGLPRYFPLPEMLESEDPFHFMFFAHLTGLISSREFSFANEDGSQAADRLVPVADMLNNNPDKTNVQQFTDGTTLYLRAVKPISAGEELFLPYLPGLDHRNDVSLTGYGFVRKLERPLLPATDLPTFDPEHPYQESPLSDYGAFYGPGGSHNSEEELERLRGLLGATPTTLEEDEELLESGDLKDWKEKVVVEFRVQRKLALKLSITTILEVLGLEA